MSKMSSEVKWFWGSVLVFALIGVVVFGPAGISNFFQAWKASAYGSDWLVVQYSQDGGVITSWELKDRAIHNETHSDGIYFIDDEGSVVHLSGHYVYIQSPTDIHKKKLIGQRKIFE